MIRRGADLEAQNALFIVTALGPADIVETWPFSGSAGEMSAIRSIDVLTWSKVLFRASES